MIVTSAKTLMSTDEFFISRNLVASLLVKRAAWNEAEEED